MRGSHLYHEITRVLWKILFFPAGGRWCSAFGACCSAAAAAGCLCLLLEQGL